MFKTTSQYRTESTEGRYGGKGVAVVSHVMEKTELLANCRLFARIRLDPGCSIGWHTHDQEEEVYYILSGEAVVNDDGVIRTVYPGDSVYTGNGGSHSIENQGSEPMEFLGVILTYQPPER
ncbi:MAG: cupin domain-containing protein [Defluviitaleaceae bacterium]|nr:cupin domain-containing protein [Defluviitaleaceae bacterium]